MDLDDIKAAESAADAGDTSASFQASIRQAFADAFPVPGLGPALVAVWVGGNGEVASEAIESLCAKCKPKTAALLNRLFGAPKKAAKKPRDPNAPKRGRKPKATQEATEPSA